MRTTIATFAAAGAALVSTGAQAGPVTLLDVAQTATSVQTTSLDLADGMLFSVQSAMNAGGTFGYTLQIATDSLTGGAAEFVAYQRSASGALTLISQGAAQTVSHTLTSMTFYGTLMQNLGIGDDIVVLTQDVGDGNLVRLIDNAYTGKASYFFDASNMGFGQDFVPGQAIAGTISFNALPVTTPGTVPEPTTPALILAAGIAALAASRRRAAAAPQPR